MTKVRVDFGCEKQFLDEFDRLILGKFENRSDAIRNGMRRVMRDPKGA